ncbi:MAG TPA: CDP-glycerol glycerophosphotransferase family protein [Sphingobium sp.]
MPHDDAAARTDTVLTVGFLFNHDALHQVRHSAPVIAELVLVPDVQVVVLTSSAAQEAEVRHLIGAAAARVRFVALSVGAAARALDAVLGLIVPFRRIAVLRENLEAFRTLDVLVVPESTSMMLRDRFGLADLKFVRVQHGSGDRSVTFRPVIARFDLMLLAGEKVRERMIAAGLTTAERSALVGYPKFDTVDPAAPGARLFANDRPTVVYNPHFEPTLSSWFDMGVDLLDWFAAQDRFNLIFAPHVMLFERRIHASVEHRRMRWRRDLPDRYAGLPHMLIDTGSAASTDMSYMKAADIYIGDISSQIYEWIARPRPAIFLNPSHTDWRGSADFAHWHLGEVVEGMDALPTALDRAVTEPDTYAAAQGQAFARTFSVTDEPASRRAARAIVAHFRQKDQAGFS